MVRYLGSNGMAFCDLLRPYPDEFSRPETRKTAVETEDAPKIVLGVEVRTATGDSADTDG